MPTAVPIPTQLTILRTYQAELQALLPETNGERLAQLEQALAQIAAEIARLEEDTTTPSTANDPTIITRHLSAAEVNPGEELAIILDWGNQTAANTTIAVHLTDSNGTLLSQVDEPFSNIMQLTLPIPETAADNSYTLAVIPYDTTTGGRINSLTLKEMLVETAVISDQCPCVWLTSATQYPRTSANDPITLIIDIAYQLDYGEKVILKPLYAHPDWETAEDGRLPIDGLGDEIILDGSVNTFGNKSITFVENPAVMRDIVGTDYPVLVMQIRHLDENGEPTSEVTMEAMPNFTLDLTSTAEVTYQMDMAETMPVPPDNRLWITEATQLPRSDPDEAITLEVTVGYKLVSAAEAMLSLSFIYPTHETIQYGFGYALGDEQRVQAGTGFVTITATIEPENITSAINSDEFKLMTGLWGVGENNEVPILISFDQEMAFNVQALEEVSYQSNSSVTNTLDRLGILDVSPPVGSVLNGRTTFTVTVFYELTTMDTANLNTTLLPAFGGAAVLGNDQQIIERGSGELTYSFEFEPLETDEPSTWMLDLRLESPQANPGEASLAAVSPHVDFPNDVYRFEP